MKDKKVREELIIDAFAMLFLLAGELYFFRNIIGTGQLISDGSDGRLTMLIAEHWYNVFKGKASIMDMGMFYPAKNTLAYSDMLLGFGLIHSVLRVVGLDIFRAYKYTIMLVHLTGTVSSYYLLHRKLNLCAGWSVFGTVMFSFSSTYAVHIYHTQLVSLSLIPLAAVFVISFYNNLKNRKKRNVYAFLFIITAEIILYTAWYIFFFTVFFVLGVVITGIILNVVNDCGLWDKTKDFFKTVKYDFVIYVVALIIIALPFLITEMSIIKMSSGREYSEVCYYLPEMIDVINVSSKNWLMGGLLTKMKLDARGFSFENAAGFSPVLLATFIGFYIFVKKDRKNSWIKTIWITVVLGIFLTVRLSKDGLSLWWFIYKFFPGGSSIRAGVRYLLYLSLPMAAVTSMMGNELTNRIGSKRISIPLVALSILAGFVSCIKTDGVSSGWNVADEVERIENVADVPADCEAFYITHFNDSDEKLVYHERDVLQIFACEIADKYNIRTINGYSGVKPENWGLVSDLESDVYEQAVSGWIERNKMKNVYAYDVIDNNWIKFDRENVMDNRINFGEKDVADLMTGILDMDSTSDYSWTQREFQVTLKNNDITKYGLKLKIGTEKDSYIKQQPDLKPYVELYVNGKKVKELDVINGNAEYSINVEPSSDDIYNIQIKTNCYFVPKQVGISNDTRELSYRLYYIEAD